MKRSVLLARVILIASALYFPISLYGIYLRGGTAHASLYFSGALVGAGMMAFVCGLLFAKAAEKTLEKESAYKEMINLATWERMKSATLWDRLRERSEKLDAMKLKSMELQRYLDGKLQQNDSGFAGCVEMKVMIDDLVRSGTTE